MPLKPKAVLLTPIAYRQRRLGGLVLASPCAISAREQSIVDRLAVQLGVTLHNLRQFGEMKLLSEQLRVHGAEIHITDRQLEEADRLPVEALSVLGGWR
ncbi:MAG: hypothetical protein A2051_02180 [Desulfovibrionales bacterium GWA2_65_9]|nr:MAG: hypothetical protein A2051_02180 [Desulfovibrionales bacterium GWA2_65_9]